MRLSVSIVAMLVATGAQPETLPAQAGSFVVMPRAGIMTQARPLTQDFRLAPDYSAKWEYSMEAASAYGGLVEVPIPNRSIGLRLEMNSTARAARSPSRTCRGC